MAINMIGQDKIAPMITDIINEIMQQKKQVELELNEFDVCAIFYEKGGVPYFALAFVDDNDCITRYDKVQKIEDFVNTMLKNI